MFLKSDFCSVDVTHLLTFATGLPLFELVVLLSSNGEGGANNFGPRPLFALSKLEHYADEVVNPHASLIWVTLVEVFNIKQVLN